MTNDMCINVKKLNTKLFYILLFVNDEVLICKLTSEITSNVQSSVETPKKSLDGRWITRSKGIRHVITNSEGNFVKFYVFKHFILVRFPLFYNSLNRWTGQFPCPVRKYREVSVIVSLIPLSWRINRVIDSRYDDTKNGDSRPNLFSLFFGPLQSVLPVRTRLRERSRLFLWSFILVFKPLPVLWTPYL